MRIIIIFTILLNIKILNCFSSKIFLYFEKYKIQIEEQMMKKKYLEITKQYEGGIRLAPYNCTSKKRTIGIGRNLETHPYTDVEKETLNKLGEDIFSKNASNGSSKIKDRLRDFYMKDFEIRMDSIEKKLEKKYKFFNELDESRRFILVDMAYNMGLDGLSKFKSMLTALRNKDYAKASNEIKNSKYYKQTKTRAQKNCLIMETGKIGS